MSIVVEHQINTTLAGIQCLWTVFYLLRYDIKGCEVSRWTDPAPAGSQIIVVLKDLNFEGQYINLGEKRAGQMHFGFIKSEPNKTFLPKCLTCAALCAWRRPPTSVATAAGGDRHQLPQEAQRVGLQPASGSAAAAQRWTQPGSLLCFAHYENKNVSCLRSIFIIVIAPTGRVKWCRLCSTWGLSHWNMGWCSFFGWSLLNITESVGFCLFARPNLWLMANFWLKKFNTMINQIKSISLYWCIYILVCHSFQ